MHFSLFGDWLTEARTRWEGGGVDTILCRGGEACPRRVRLVVPGTLTTWCVEFFIPLGGALHSKVPWDQFLPFHGLPYVAASKLSGD